MEERFSILKNTFIDILRIKEKNIEILQVLTLRIKKIKEYYADFISSNKDTLSIFTLDSFHFQGRLIDIEYEDMNRLFLSISNRMYCDYYKLFKIIVEYIESNIIDHKLLELIYINKNQYPVYKDLEPFKQYDLAHIQNLHELLLVILHYLNGFVIKKEHDLQNYQTKNKIGFNIDSFVHSFNYNNIVIKEKISLFVTFMEFFHTSHMKYLKRFTTKLQLMLSQVNNDIKIENHDVEKDDKKTAMQYLKSVNIDRSVLHDLKNTIGDEDFSISSDSDKGGMRTNSDASNPSIIRTDASSNFVLELNMYTNVSELSDDNGVRTPVKYQKKEFSNIDGLLTASPCGTPNVTPNQSVDENTYMNGYSKSESHVDSSSSSEEMITNNNIVLCESKSDFQVEYETASYNSSSFESIESSRSDSSRESPRESRSDSQPESHSDSSRESHSDSQPESHSDSSTQYNNYELLEPEP